MWIAKNSRTGKTYGKKFSSIYDCQTYIDNELYILEYLYRRIEVIERKIKNINEFTKYMNKKYPNGYGIIEEMIESFSFALRPLNKEIQKAVNYTLQGKEIKQIATDEYTNNNIIRCYNTEQKRFAEGMDF